MKPRAWFVYVLKCADGTLYTGATVDLERRLAAHAAGKGAKYTRGRGPIELAWKRRVKDRSAALKLEARLKKLKRADKLRLR
ncbi:MAG TPA: GIY-YIG nuclease family protein [Candidatus Baltobacteraceae bacterium]|nr:GIY-YIG nuclease family protein [Candidatus Baltobacteraceae bacterium]